VENSFQTILEQVVLAQNPDLFIYAHKLEKGLIPSMESIIVRVYKDSKLFPTAPEGFKFKNPESYANVRARVVLHNKITNQVLLEDGNWVEAKPYTTSESSWISELEPIEVLKKELTPQIEYTTEEDIV
jgi:hypothetical protein